MSGIYWHTWPAPQVAPTQLQPASFDDLGWLVTGGPVVGKICNLNCPVSVHGVRFGRHGVF